MKLQSLLAACLVLSVLAIPSLAQDKANTEASQSATKKLEELKPHKNDAKKLNEFFSAQFRSAFTLMESGKTDESEKVLNDLDAVVAGLNPDNAQAKSLVGQAKRVVGMYRERLVLAKTSVKELKDKLAAKPGDKKSFDLLIKKYSSDLATAARSDARKASKDLEELKKYVTELAAKVDDDAKKSSMIAALSGRQLAGVAQMIASEMRLLELVGKPATSLDVQAWLNGSPLTDADIKGKVVLLDFWAVWCGPCIATFPHLREWHEKYDEKDFVIIGVTNYENRFVWDDAAGRIKSAGKKTSTEEEHEMLNKFAEHHKLHHRFAIAKNRDMSKYYGVRGIPHVVLLDREGVIRLIRVGSGEKNAKDIANMIEQLVNG